MTEKPLPIEVSKVCRLCGARTTKEKEAVQNILDEFFILISDGWVNNRVENEINSYHVNSEKNRENGKKGGCSSKNKPNNNPVGFDSVNVGFENESQKNLNH